MSSVHSEPKAQSQAEKSIILTGPRKASSLVDVPLGADQIKEADAVSDNGSAYTFNTTEGKAPIVTVSSREPHISELKKPKWDEVSMGSISEPAFPYQEFIKTQRASVVVYQPGKMCMVKNLSEKNAHLGQGRKADEYVFYTPSFFFQVDSLTPLDIKKFWERNLITESHYKHLLAFTDPDSKKRIVLASEQPSHKVFEGYKFPKSTAITIQTCIAKIRYHHANILHRLKSSEGKNVPAAAKLVHDQLSSLYTWCNYSPILAGGCVNYAARLEHGIKKNYSEFGLKNMFNNFKLASCLYRPQGITDEAFAKMTKNLRDKLYGNDSSSLWVEYLKAKNKANPMVGKVGPKAGVPAFNKPVQPGVSFAKAAKAGIAKGAAAASSFAGVAAAVINSSVNGPLNVAKDINAKASVLDSTTDKVIFAAKTAATAVKDAGKKAASYVNKKGKKAVKYIKEKVQKANWVGTLFSSKHAIFAPSGRVYNAIDRLVGNENPTGLYARIKYGTKLIFGGLAKIVVTPVTLVAGFFNSIAALFGKAFISSPDDEDFATEEEVFKADSDVDEE
jgi:hypothetical protein